MSEASIQSNKAGSERRLYSGGGSDSCERFECNDELPKHQLGGTESGFSSCEGAKLIWRPGAAADLREDPKDRRREKGLVLTMGSRLREVLD